MQLLDLFDFYIMTFVFRKMIGMWILRCINDIYLRFFVVIKFLLMYVNFKKLNAYLKLKERSPCNFSIKELYKKS